MKITTKEAVRLLLQGEVVALPTETVYGLAATLSDEEAIRRVFLLKGRPSRNPLIIHVGEMCDLLRYVVALPSDAELLAKHFWPGPLTIILPVDPSAVASIARAGLPSAAFRIPDHPLTAEVLKETGPLVMPSANLSGKPSATTSAHVESDFGVSFPIVEGGFAEKGVESTVIMSSDGRWHIARLGAITPSDFLPVLGYAPEIGLSTREERPLCPGALFRHYAPEAILSLSEKIPSSAAGVVLGFSDRIYPERCIVWPLGHSAAPDEVAASLYDQLRRLDVDCITHAFVDMHFPREGLWETIAERLHKAASKQ